MPRFLFLPGLALVLLGLIVAAAPPGDWRADYDGTLFAPQAIKDFDAAGDRLDTLLVQLAAEGELTPAGLKRIREEVENIKYDYVSSHFSTRAEQEAGRAAGSNYDSIYIQESRKPAPSK